MSDEAQTLGTFSAAFPGIVTGNWIRSRAVGNRTCMLIWDAGVTGVGLNHCATAPIPDNLILM